VLLQPINEVAQPAQRDHHRAEEGSEHQAGDEEGEQWVHPLIMAARFLGAGGCSIPILRRGAVTVARQAGSSGSGEVQKVSKGLASCCRSSSAF
jgi:hypothetical protein